MNNQAINRPIKYKGVLIALSIAAIVCYVVSYIMGRFTYYSNGDHIFVAPNAYNVIMGVLNLSLYVFLLLYFVIFYKKAKLDILLPIIIAARVLLDMIGLIASVVTGSATTSQMISLILGNGIVFAFNASLCLWIVNSLNGYKKKALNIVPFVLYMVMPLFVIIINFSNYVTALNNPWSDASTEAFYLIIFIRQLIASCVPALFLTAIFIFIIKNEHYPLIKPTAEQEIKTIENLDAPEALRRLNESLERGIIDEAVYEAERAKILERL